MAIKLYGLMISTRTTRVMIVLHEKQLPYEFIKVDLFKGEHKAPDYLKKQPFGQLPVLVGTECYDATLLLLTTAHAGTPLIVGPFVAQWPKPGQTLWTLTNTNTLQVRFCRKVLKPPAISGNCEVVCLTVIDRIISYDAHLFQ